MLRRSLALLVLCALAGCQDYNFNPVGKCVIQPGSARIKLSSLGTADVLFVIDDSGSMAPEQGNLARNFGSFIDALKVLQAQRAADKLEFFEFHVAVTTSSVFEGWLPASGSPTCSGSPLQCAITASRYSGSPTSNLCSDPTDSGQPCDDLVESYPPTFGSCNRGLAAPGTSYPQGGFVAAAGNPTVLHFTKDVWDPTSPTSVAALATLSAQFSKNIAVGTCGSGMEQHFEAGRLAVEKALAGTQPGVKADEWPHAGAKLVVVWVGDEDDCSNPNDPAKALAFDPKDPLGSSAPGADVCISDQTKATIDPSYVPKQFALDRYASYFTGLGRSFGAAFIYSSDPTSCKDEKDASGNPTGNRICTPGTCICQCPASCGGVCGRPQTAACQADPTGPGCECQIDLTATGCSGKAPSLAVPGNSRFGELSALFRQKGVNTFEASVCDANWGTTLQGIAQLVVPPKGLSLPTQPAATDVALLRIESADGKTSRYCTGPAKSQAELDTVTADWSFVDCKTGAEIFGGQTSACISINPNTVRCKANPGESFIAQYLGIVPSKTADNPLGGCAVASDCQKILGGALTDWQCTPVGTSSRGTCTCGGG